MYTIAPAETLCSFAPHWAEDVKLQRRYITTITETEEGNEQRSGIRPTVEHGLSFTVQTKNQAQTSYLRRRLNKYVNQVWHVPIWPYEMQLTSEASAGSSVLNVDEATYRELDQIGPSGEVVEVVLHKDYNTFESGEILSFDSTTITLDKNLDSTWAQGSKVYPLFKATLGMAVDLEAPTQEHSVVGLSFNESFRSISGEA